MARGSKKQAMQLTTLQLVIFIAGVALAFGLILFLSHVEFPQLF
jgi:hypothetical protein